MMQVRNFFEYANLKDFRTDWEALTPEDKEQLKTGIVSGSLTY